MRWQSHLGQSARSADDSEGPTVSRAARAAPPREDTAGGSGATDEDRSEPIESSVQGLPNLSPLFSPQLHGFTKHHPT